MLSNIWVFGKPCTIQAFKGVEFDSFKARSGSNLNRAAREQLSLLLRSSAADGLEGGELGSGRALPSAS